MFAAPAPIPPTAGLKGFPGLAGQVRAASSPRTPRAGIHEESDRVPACCQFLACDLRRIALAWEGRRGDDAADQEWRRRESGDDGAGAHRGQETNAFAK